MSLQEAVACATAALAKYGIEKDVAGHIKKVYRHAILGLPSSACRNSDKKYHPTWHCVVGRNFGSFVTHETKHFSVFFRGQVVGRDN